MRRPPTTLARLVALALCALGLGLPARAQAPKPATKTDLAGEWTGPLVLDQGTENLALVFKVADSTVTGVVYSNGSKFDDMEGVTFKGNTVHFKMQTLDFTGTIEGTTMKVALIMYNGSTRTFRLKKTPKLS